MSICGGGLKVEDSRDWLTWLFGKAMFVSVIFIMQKKGRNFADVNGYCRLFCK